MMWWQHWSKQPRGPVHARRSNFFLAYFCGNGGRRGEVQNFLSLGGAMALFCYHILAYSLCRCSVRRGKCVAWGACSWNTQGRKLYKRCLELFLLSIVLWQLIVQKHWVYMYYSQLVVWMLFFIKNTQEREHRQSLLPERLITFLSSEQ